MKKSLFNGLRPKRALFLPVLLAILTCQGAFAQSDWEKKVVDSIKNDKFAEAAATLDALENLSDAEKTQRDWYFELMRRIRIEFRHDEDAIRAQLKERGLDPTDEQMRAWEEKKQLEMRPIDGERRYFKNAASNLFRLDPALVKSGVNTARIKNIEKIIAASKGDGDLTDPRRCVFTFVATIPANAVPAGETLRFWAPFPRETSPRQQDVKLVSTEPAGGKVAPATDLQRCVYLEKVAVQDEPTVFKVVFETTAYAQYYSQEYLLANAKPYDTDSEFYKEFTAERLPHIIKTEQMKEFAREAVGEETNPVKKVSLIFDKIDASFPWASSNEYGTMFSIPEYVLEEGHGDCGMQGLTLISALRCEGIPAKWQSGWVWEDDGSCGMHDWAEVYYEGVGWVPIDMSYGLTKTDKKVVRDFYKSGFDHYRLIINDDYSRPFTPEKKFFRSEPVDFQGGEVEWDGGNLYFNEWSKKLTVEFKD